MVILEFGGYKFTIIGLTFFHQIMDNADVVLTFWDGKSTGTKYTLDYANKQQKTVYIYHYQLIYFVANLS